MSDGSPTLYLASGSPRRRELLAGAGIAHEVLPARLDDGLLAPGDVRAREWVVALAWFKGVQVALVLRERAVDSAVVLAGDTLVSVEDDNGVETILGQPRDAEEAVRMIRLMRDREHAVHTGIALVDPATFRRDLFVDSASVRVGHIPDEAIDAYVATGQWRGKAGAYNLNERLGAGWPIEVSGDPGTVIGLPVGLVAARLARFCEEPG